MMTLGTRYLTDKRWYGVPEGGTLEEKRVLCAWNGELTVRGTEEIIWMKGRQHLYTNTGPICVENTHMFLLLLPMAPATLLVGSEVRIDENIGMILGARMAAGVPGPRHGLPCL